MKTYLELVNEAISECKISLDPLTAANFDTPPRTGLYNHFKRWVNDVYRELMIDRPEWFFRSERTTVKVWPRLHLSGLAYIPAVGDVLESANTGVRFTVKGVYNFEDNEADPTVERTVEVEYEDGSTPADLTIREAVNMISPTSTDTVGYVAHDGRYNFDHLPGFDSLDMESVKTFFEDSNVVRTLIPVNWENWVDRYSYYPYVSADHPSYITQAPDGNYEVFPKPINPFYLDFTFTRSFSEMVAFDDTPVGVPEQFIDILRWMTVAEYADFDNNAKLYSRASKKLSKYDYFLMRDKLPKVSFARSRFTIDNDW